MLKQHAGGLRAAAVRTDVQWRQTVLANTTQQPTFNHAALTLHRPAKAGSVAEWLACWTRAQKGRVQVAVATLSGNSLRQTAHTDRESVHQAAKLVAAILRVAGVTAGLVESNGSLPSGL